MIEPRTQIKQHTITMDASDQTRNAGSPPISAHLMLPIIHSWKAFSSVPTLSEQQIPQTAAVVPKDLWAHQCCIIALTRAYLLMVFIRPLNLNSHFLLVQTQICYHIFRIWVRTKHVQCGARVCLFVFQISLLKGVNSISFWGWNIGRKHRGVWK